MHYPSNAECVWKITVPENAVLQLKFQEFDTEFDKECSHDYLDIHYMKAEEGIIERCIVKNIASVCTLQHKIPFLFSLAMSVFAET